MRSLFEQHRQHQLIRRRLDQDLPSARQIVLEENSHLTPIDPVPPENDIRMYR
jgi:hypothetical protein